MKTEMSRKSLIVFFLWLQISFLPERINMINFILEINSDSNRFDLESLSDYFKAIEKKVSYLNLS